MVRSARSGVLVAALLLSGLAACGDDEPESALTEDEQTVADNLASQILRSGSMAGGGSSRNAVTDEQAACIGEGAVTEVGLETLQDYGIVTDDLLVNRSIQGVEMGAADADALAGVFVECIDAEALFEERFLTELPPGGEEPDRRTCVEDAVDRDAVQEILSASFQGADTRAYARLQRAVSACAEAEGSEQ